VAGNIGSLLQLVPWKAYERAMFNELYYAFRPPEYEVRPDFSELVGMLSLITRQIDVAVLRQGFPARPFLSVECKRYNRKLDVNDVGEFAVRIEDVGAEHGILVGPVGFTRGARNLAAAKGIRLHELSLQCADRLLWREIARATYPWDEMAHPQMGDALYVLHGSDEVDEWVGWFEELPFEEWEATLLAADQISPRRCRRLLRSIAQTHRDDAWRFNAIRLLREVGWLDSDFCQYLLKYETDAQTRGLLMSYL